MNKIIKNLFGRCEGKDVYRFTLLNAKGNSVSIINYGGIITSWLVKDKKGVRRNIVAGFNKLEDYLSDTAYFGCIVGRYANRIANGNFSVNGRSFNLACNNGKNHLHGGNKGFGKVIWDADVNETPGPLLALSYLSKDGEEGYPGNLNVNVNYFYTEEDELIIEYAAETDKAGPVSLTSHCYFNLAGNMRESILDHLLLINADHYTPVNEDQIPTGELKRVDKTAFDFRRAIPIAANCNEVEVGYDHNFVLNKVDSDFSFAASLVDPGSELKLSVFTTEPGLQLYTGNLLDGNTRNSDGKPINRQAALCLETQHFPDSPNQPDFPPCILLPAEKYYSRTIYRITV